jgi:hypothetical protein
LPHRIACAHRFSQPLDASRRPAPAGLISCRIRSWGCTLQSLVPLAWPYAVSDAVPLLTFERPENTTAPATFAPRRSATRVHQLPAKTPTCDRNRSQRSSARHVTAADNPRPPKRTRSTDRSGPGLSRCRRNGLASNPTLPPGPYSAEAPHRRSHRRRAPEATGHRSTLRPPTPATSSPQGLCRNAGPSTRAPKRCPGTLHANVKSTERKTPSALRHDRRSDHGIQRTNHDVPGDVLAFRGLLPARIRSPATGGLVRPQARSSPGLVPSRALPLVTLAPP